MSKSDWIKLKADDGFELAAWRAEPEGAPRGAVVVIQEIFGVNSHIRSIADRLAAEGYLAIAPAGFDRLQPGFDVGYGDADRAVSVGLMQKIVREDAMKDIAAAIAAGASAGKVGIVGFCMGGTFVWAAAANLSGLSAAVGYYGGGILGLKDLQPKIPTMLHFGELDGHIPVAGVRELAAQHPDVQVFLYNANHGFHCDQRASYDAPSAAEAWGRTIPFFRQHIG